MEYDQTTVRLQLNLMGTHKIQLIWLFFVTDAFGLANGQSLDFGGSGQIRKWRRYLDSQLWARFLSFFDTSPSLVHSVPSACTLFVLWNKGFWCIGRRRYYCVIFAIGLSGNIKFQACRRDSIIKWTSNKTHLVSLIPVRPFQVKALHKHYKIGKSIAGVRSLKITINGEDGFQWID